MQMKEKSILNSIDAYMDLQHSDSVCQLNKPVSSDVLVNDQR